MLTLILSKCVSCCHVIGRLVLCVNKRLNIKSNKPTSKFISFEVAHLKKLDELSSYCIRSWPFRLCFTISVATSQNCDCFCCLGATMCHVIRLNADKLAASSVVPPVFAGLQPLPVFFTTKIAFISQQNRHLQKVFDLEKEEACIGQTKPNLTPPESSLSTAIYKQVVVGGGAMRYILVYAGWMHCALFLAHCSGGVLRWHLRYNLKVE